MIVYLDVGEELEFVGLERFYYLLFDCGGVAEIRQGVVTEDVHLLVGEICFCEDVLDFYQSSVEGLEPLPELIIYVQTAAEVEVREERGSKVFAWNALLPDRSTGETENEGFDGGVALRLERGDQGVDALTGSWNDVLIRDDTEAVGC